jgi:GNAT superfamily N-acetyltransferase
MRTERATVHIRTFTPEEAVIAASWRYPGDLSMYDGEPNNWGQFLEGSDTGHGYYAIVDDNELVGFCCLGPEGRVAGQPAKHNGLLDVGGGIRPDLVGRGLGAVGLTAILGYARDPTYGALGWSYVALASFSVVYLGEHYLVDVLAGLAVAEAVQLAEPAFNPLARRVARRLELVAS